MSFDNTKYHIELNSVPYIVSGYQRTELNTFIPRLGAGDTNESLFDLLRTKTLDSFEGGSLQRYWNDDTSVFAIENLFPYYDDGVLYPVNNSTTTSSFGSGRPIITAKTKTKDYAFFSWESTTGGASGGIKRVDSSGTVINLTVPTAIANAARRITDMVIWRGNLVITSWKTSDSTYYMYYMPLTSTTVSEIAGGNPGSFGKMVVWKDQLYGTNTGGGPNWVLYRYTGDFTNRGFVVVGTTPMQTGCFTASLLLYNNRIYLARDDGLYAYDGVSLITVEDATDQVNSNNYRFVSKLKGYMYYWMPDGLYRFNGSLIEKVYDNTEVGMPVDMISSKNRLWIAFVNSAYSGSARYDKSMGYDYSSTQSVDGRIMVFDGKGIFSYNRIVTTTKSGSPLIATEGEIDSIYWFNDDLYIFTEADPSSNHYLIDTNESLISGNKTWRITTSIFDGSFPMIDKNAEGVEVVLDGNVSSDQDILIEYRISGFDGSTGWQTAGTIKTQSELNRFIWKSVTSGLTFKKIQFRLSGTTAYSYGIKQFIVRYTLVPEYKNQWTMTLNCFGDDDFEPLQLNDLTNSTQLVQLLRGNIYSSRNSKVPIKFIDIDQLDLNGAINNSVTTIVLNSTLLLKGSTGFIQIDDEIMYYTSKTSTELTVIRGSLGTVAVSHSDNSKVFLLYRVIIRQIQNERILLDKDEPSSEDKSRSSEITLVLQEV